MAKIKQSESLALLQQQVAKLEAERDAAVKARDKFRADFQEATKWSGYWKNKYYALQSRVAGPRAPSTANAEPGSYRERAERARQEAMRTGTPAKV